MKFCYLFVCLVTATELTRTLLGILKNGRSEGAVGLSHDPLAKEVVHLFISACKGWFIDTEDLSFYAHNFSQMHELYIDINYHKTVYEFVTKINANNVHPVETVALLFGRLAAYLDSKNTKETIETQKLLEPLIEGEVVQLFQLFEFDYRGKRSQFMLLKRFLWTLPRNSAEIAEETREKFVRAMELIENSKALLSVKRLAPLSLSIYALCKEYVALLDKFKKNSKKVQIYRALNSRDMFILMNRLKSEAMDIVGFEIPGIEATFDVEMHDGLIKFLNDASTRYLSGVMRSRATVISDIAMEIKEQKKPKSQKRRYVPEIEYSIDELLAIAKQRLRDYRHLIGEKMFELNGTWYHSYLARLFLAASDVLSSFPNEYNSMDDLILAFDEFQTFRKGLRQLFMQRRNVELKRLGKNHKMSPKKTTLKRRRVIPNTLIDKKSK